MCTVTFVRSSSDRFALVVNRDESRRRSKAQSPILRHAGTRTLVMPIDPDGGGTWVGANNAGLVATLLNHHPSARPSGAAGANSRSRGLIIPEVLASEELMEAQERLRHIDATQYRPFRLVISDGERIIESRSDGLDPSAVVTAVRPALTTEFWTSSGLGDELVDTPRRTLFDQMMLSASDPLAAQRAFHEHSWPDQPHLSVCMSRDTAWTVSRTEVIGDPHRLIMRYVPRVSETGWEAASVTVLPRWARG